MADSTFRFAGLLAGPARRIAAVTAMVATVPTLFASAATPAASGLAEAIANGKASLGVRYRFEHVDQEPFADPAKASTARARLTWTSAPAGSVTMGIETDYVFAIGFEDFNSTTNGRTGYPVVPDPEGFDLNQAFLRYADDKWTLTGGRQRIAHGTARFVGNVGFRQNEQTFDAVRLQRESERFDFDYAYVHNVNRIFGPVDGVQPADWYGDSHLVRTIVKPAQGHSISVFAYFLDFANANGPRASSATQGIEWDATMGAFSAHASVARQTDWGANPAEYDALFYAAQVGWRQGAFNGQLGLQNLGSDEGAMAFGTPLATLHKFQGWTDKLLVTPRTGVVDRWVAVGARLGNANATLIRHDFRADEGDAKYGTETGLSMAMPVGKHASLQIKAARYSAETHATDTTKLWLALDWRM